EADSMACNPKLGVTGRGQHHRSGKYPERHLHPAVLRLLLQRTRMNQLPSEPTVFFHVSCTHRSHYLVLRKWLMTISVTTLPSPALAGEGLGVRADGLPIVTHFCKAQ